MDVRKRRCYSIFTFICDCLWGSRRLKEVDYLWSGIIIWRKVLNITKRCDFDDVDEDAAGWFLLL